MTECPKCKGYGIVGSAVPDILRGKGHIFSSNECDMCHGSGEVPMTNEEWLRQCTTMELAEFIRKQRDDWSDGWYSDCHRFEEIVEWLKEIHE